MGLIKFAYDTLFNKESPIDCPAEEMIVQEGEQFVFYNPLEFNSIIGQSSLKEILKCLARVANEESIPIPHILLHGPAGYGKTTIARAIQFAADVGIYYYTGGALSKRDVMDCLTELSYGDIIFIDEIHSCNKKVLELLYEAMQDFSVDGIRIPRFTLIAATTRPGKLAKPMTDRFKINKRLQDYSVSDLTEMVEKVCSNEDVDIASTASYKIACICRGVPRIASNYAYAVCLYIKGLNKKYITFSIAIEALRKTLGVYESGLTDRDYKYMDTLSVHKGVAGLATIAKAMEEEPDDIAESIEPYLIRRGLVNLSAGGRVLTKYGLSELKEWDTEKKV